MGPSHSRDRSRNIDHLPLVEGSMTKEEYFKLELGRKLGEGGFATVFSARDKRDEWGAWKYAVKIMGVQALSTGPKPDLDASARIEVAALRRVSHKNVATLRGVYKPEMKGHMSTQSSYLLILDLAEGGNLEEHIRRGPMDERVAWGFFTQLIEGVEECHRKGVVHRDIKPSNILLESNNRVKLADFGIACISEDSKEADWDPKFTGVSGTNYMLAPEQIRAGMARGKSLPITPYSGKAVDIWCCGLTLFLMMSGAGKFRQSDQWVGFWITMGKFGIPTWFGADVRDLLRSLLTDNPADRLTLKQIKEHRWFVNGPEPKQATWVERVLWKPVVNCRRLSTCCQSIENPTVWSCRTCGGDWVCDGCVATCHSGHDLSSSRLAQEVAAGKSREGLEGGCWCRSEICDGRHPAIKLLNDHAGSGWEGEGDEWVEVCHGEGDDPEPAPLGDLNPDPNTSWARLLRQLPACPGGDDNSFAEIPPWVGAPGHEEPPTGEYVEVGFE